MIETRALMPPVPHGGKTAAVVLTIVVHCILLLFLIYGISWQTAPPESVSVALVRNVPLGPPTPVEEETPSPPPAAEPVQKAEPKPEPRAANPAKPDIVVKGNEKPSKKVEKPPRPAASTHSSTPSMDFNDLLKADSSRQQAAANAAATKNSAAKELESRAGSRAAQNYKDRIAAKVRGNIVVPPGVSGNLEAIFDVTQLPGGEILSVRLKKSSGHPGLDRAIERAILKSSPLPPPEQSNLFERNLELKLRPLDQ